MLLTRLFPAALGVSALMPWVTGCGGRSEVVDPAGPARLEAGVPFADALAAEGRACQSDGDCATLDACAASECQTGSCRALPPILCEDDDPCTVDACDPDKGACTHTRPNLDRDGDGYYAPEPGLPLHACATDCDDASAVAHPGGTEICDGRDNDCDGAIDEGFEYLPSGAPALLLSTDPQGGLGGVTHDGEGFVVSMSYYRDHQQNELTMLSDAAEIESRRDVALVNSDTSAGPVLWANGALATAWEDRRDDDFEIYFVRMDAMGSKLGPDLRVSTGNDFSLNPALLFTGKEYVVVWDDRRTGAFHVFGQRIDADGALVTAENVDLTPELDGAEAPSVAQGEANLGLVFNAEQDGRRVHFRSVSADLTELGEIVVVSEAGGVGAEIAWNRDRYLVTWSEYETLPGNAIWGAVLSGSGELLSSPAPITPPAEFARSHSLLPLGDRSMLFWSEYRDQSYDLYAIVLDQDLQALTSAARITSAAGDALAPAPTLSDAGLLGLAFADFSDGAPQIYFTTLPCSPSR